MVLKVYLISKLIHVFMAYINKNETNYKTQNIFVISENPQIYSTLVKSLYNGLS